MQWVKQHWVAVAVGVVAVGAGVGLAIWSSNSSRDAGVVVDVEEKDVANETPDLILGNSTTPKRTGGAASPLPLFLPGNLVPWGTGNSDQATPSTGGTTSTSPPANQVPWGTGPSQQ